MDYSFDDIRDVEVLSRQVFPSSPTILERVAEGVSTCVYRIIHNNETFYLRILPEEGQSFAPEVAAHQQLRQMGVKVPEVIYFKPCYEPLQRSVMVSTELNGQPVSQSSTVSQAELDTIMVEAGRDVARINSIPVDGFGWIQRAQHDTTHLRAELPTFRDFALEFWDADIAYLAEHVLSLTEVTALTRIRYLYDSWLDETQAYLAHGDLDTTHIFQDNGHYTGIIDFGEIRGANPLYDTGHFHMRDGEYLPYQLLPALLHGYQEVTPLPSDYMNNICFMSLLINMRALVRSLRKRPPNRFTMHQIEALRRDLGAL